MAEWCLSESDSDEAWDQERELSDMESVHLGSLKIPCSRVLDLMKQVEKKRVFDLDCLSEVHRKRHKSRKRKTGKNKVQSPVGSALKSTEDVSETASEVRSSASITASDFNENRRTNLIRFDPLFDPELDDQPITIDSKQNRGKKVPPKPHQGKKLASLDKILEANTRRRQQIQSDAKPTSVSLQSESQKSITSPCHESVDVSNTDHNNSSAYSDDKVKGQQSHSNGFSRGLSPDSNQCLNKCEKLLELRDMPTFGFDDDDDSDMETSTREMDMKLTLLSQINRVENILDSEGLG